MYTGLCLQSSTVWGENELDLRKVSKQKQRCDKKKKKNKHEFSVLLYLDGKTSKLSADNRADAEMPLFVMQLKATQLQAAVTPSSSEL